MAIKRIARLVFVATNNAIDLSYEGREYGGIQFWVVLKWPLFIRRIKCSHERAISRQLSWCFRCERPVLETESPFMRQSPDEAGLDMKPDRIDRVTYLGYTENGTQYKPSRW